jgi:hypothetical protein
MKGWHTAGKITQSGPIKFWDPAELGARVKQELVKGVTKKESLGEVLAGN